MPLTDDDCSGVFTVRPKNAAYRNAESALKDAVELTGAAGRVQCVRAISTYIKNNAGAEDDTFLDSFKIATADYVREAVRVRHLADFENKQVQRGGLPYPGRDDHRW